MLLEDLGIGIALTSTPCAPILAVSITMTDLIFSEGMGIEFYQGPHQNILAPIDGLQDEHLVTQVLDIGKNEVDGQIPLEQIISQPEDSRQKKLNSNNIVVKNLRQLDVNNSSLDVPSINSIDIKHRKRDDDGKHNS
ncbi:hypothetical protein Ancab_027588 [Ancistrocladus abbreviatus]